MQLSRTLGWAASFAVLGLAWARAVEARPPLPRGLPGRQLKGKPLPEDDPRLRAVEAYILATRKGVALEPGKH